MSGFKNLQYGSDLKGETIRSVVEERDGAYTKDLLMRLEQISRPEEKIGGNVLLILAAMAKYARWLPDRLHVVLTARGDRTEMDLQTEIGDVRERLWRKLRFNAPIEEFADVAHKMAQHKQCPFKIEQTKERDRVARVALAMLGNIRALTLPPERPLAGAAPPEPARAERPAAKSHASDRPPKKPGKAPPAKQAAPSILPLVQPDAAKKPASDLAPPPSAGPSSAGPASQPISTDDVDEGW